MDKARVSGRLNKAPIAAAKRTPNKGMHRSARRPLPMFLPMPLARPVMPGVRPQSNNAMQQKYGKPKRFSDPYNDWDDCPERLVELAQIPDDELTLDDFEHIYSIHLPAADYQEGLYYIPLCFDHMLKKLDPIDSNICSGLLWFITHFRKKLEADDFYNECIMKIIVLAHSYTQEFELIRLSDDELKEYGIDYRYREMPKHSSSVNRLVDHLIRYPDYWTILCDWIEGLNNAGLVGSCWWIEISHHARGWHTVYREDDPANERKEKLISRMHKFGEYSRHAREARPFIAGKGFYEYNRRTSIA